ncbi:hypothetical protein SAMN02787142_3866 [Burkholderia sp. WP9]|nr:hypothetical protein SAMN02787142_3866 [Burkholderia sp. WP9]
MHHSGCSGQVSPEWGRRHSDDVALLAMDSMNTDLQAIENKFALAYIERKAVELLSICRQM